METKSSGVAIVLSFFWTGLGQLYAGRIGRGLAMMLGAPVVWTMAWFGGIASCGAALAPKGHAASVGGVGLLAVLIAVGYWVFGMLDAKRLCERHNAGTAALT